LLLRVGLYRFFLDAKNSNCESELVMQSPGSEQKLLDLINDLDHFRQNKWFSPELNIFKALGLYRQEIRHSNFLAFLLSPQQNHALKDGFLKRLIQKASDKFAGDPPITPLKIALADFSDATVTQRSQGDAHDACGWQIERVPSFAWHNQHRRWPFCVRRGRDPDHQSIPPPPTLSCRHGGRRRA
jgi:hypothetical protein